MRLSIRSDCNRTNEARPIDGASRFCTFRQIILPNAYPALAALASFQGLFGVNWNWVLAGAMFNAVPIILLGQALRKKLPKREEHVRGAFGQTPHVPRVPG
ncbi:MAG TPA: hypothetical protein VIN63_00265 [Candidatus Limnocylindria bacterium]